MEQSKEGGGAGNDFQKIDPKEHALAQFGMDFNQLNEFGASPREIAMEMVKANESIAIEVLNQIALIVCHAV